MDEDGISELREGLMAVLCTEVMVTFAGGDAGGTLVAEKLLEGKTTVEERTGCAVILVIVTTASVTFGMADVTFGAITVDATAADTVVELVAAVAILASRRHKNNE